LKIIKSVKKIHQWVADCHFTYLAVRLIVISAFPVLPWHVIKTVGSLNKRLIKDPWRLQAM
jgi:hypothetical protein